MRILRYSVPEFVLLEQLNQLRHVGSVDLVDVFVAWMFNLVEVNGAAD
jgi:hypothetical protein